MPIVKGKEWIYQLRIKWMIFHLGRSVAISLAVTFVFAAIAVYLLSWSPWLSVVVFLIVLLICLLVKPSWKIKAPDIARYLNRVYPEVEESADLILKNTDELTVLQQLQAEKVSRVLVTMRPPTEPLKKLYVGLALLVTGLLMSFAIKTISSSSKKLVDGKQVSTDQPVIKENIPTTIADFEVTIQPPTYTGKTSRQQKQFNIRTENGAQLHWKIQTNVPVKKLTIIFNDKEIFKLKATDSKSTVFAYQQTIEKSGFYQLVLDGQKSDLYQIEVIPDLPVNIKINTPAQHTTIDIGQPQKINLNVSLTDDYGIHEAYVAATLASGKGEGVSFTEKKLSFETAINNIKNIVLRKQIDLKSLGMKPGDELYFFVKAMDNHGQLSRSDIYFVSIVDTTELMSMAGMTNGVSLVPEYFRSQRQIIIDTEKLLKEQPTLSATAFKTRSNELGIDQKLLRLRYGKFLGEEDETEIGGEHHDDDGHDHGKNTEEKFGDATAIMDKYAHKHDIAEDATFFEPTLKAQLKAVLAEMWKSELRLRTYQPQEALPFEYKALRLLKDLQQKSRAYVAKTTVKKAALKPEKRLTGELDKITQPVQKMSFEGKENRTAQIKRSLSLLENRKTGNKFNQDDQFILQATEKYMIGAAADHPRTYLEALTHLRKLATGQQLSTKAIEKVQQALQKMLKPEQAKPQAKNTIQATTLAQSYFDHLKKEKNR